ncbi:MAG: hypothetical protein AAGC55_19465 [Myxococcota bacterium]
MSQDTQFIPSAHVGQTVTIHGTAYDARAGAIVELADRTPIYIKGLREWESALEGKPVEVTGLLNERPSPMAKRPADGMQAHGLPGATYVLDNPSWKLAE